MPSTGSQAGPVDSQMGWCHRYGLPLWMRSNIDRLNVSTDFEEYACSPPETDSGFIPDFDAKFSTPLMGEQPQLPINTQGLKNSKSASKLCETECSTQHHELCRALKEATRQNFLSNSAVMAVPHILGCHSSSTSTETTPSTTPQGSPFNVRKTFHKEEDASCSRKWYYSGGRSEKADTMPVLAETTDSAVSVAPVKKPHPRRKPLVPKGYRKYMVSNFDLNAVSPTSW